MRPGWLLPIIAGWFAKAGAEPPRIFVLFSPEGERVGFDELLLGPSQNAAHYLTEIIERFSQHPGNQSDLRFRLNRPRGRRPAERRQQEF